MGKMPKTQSSLHAGLNSDQHETLNIDKSGSGLVPVGSESETPAVKDVKVNLL